MPEKEINPEETLRRAQAADDRLTDYVEKFAEWCERITPQDAPPQLLNLLCISGTASILEKLDNGDGVFDTAKLKFAIETITEIQKLVLEACFESVEIPEVAAV